MLTIRPHRRTALIPKGGFTLVELLVVIGIIAILAGVALGPITNGIRQAQHNAAMQTGRQLGQVSFSYSTDNSQNGNAYPADSTATAIAQDLINASYVQDPSIFGIPQQAGYIKPVTSGSTTTMLNTGVSWVYTCAALSTTGGLTSSASDLTPMIFFNNGFGNAPASPFPATPGSAKTVTYGTAAPFKTDGTAVFYKGNNATYIKANTGTVGQIPAFISANDTDTTTYLIAP